MIEFETYSGSLYQVDVERRLVRRMTGTHEPTPSQGSDGEWKTYGEISDIKPDRCVFIVWGNGSSKFTQTSFVTAVREVNSIDS